jgi:hypothetical protein
VPVTAADYAFFDKPPVSTSGDCRISCESCKHIQRDAINPAAGISECAVLDEMHYPMARHVCPSYKANK